MPYIVLFFFFDLISLEVVSVFYSILSKEPEIIDIIPQIPSYLC